MAVGEGRIEPSVQPASRAATAPPRDWAALVSRVAFILLLIFFCVIFVYPLIWLVSASLKLDSHVFNNQLIPDPVMWSNYATIFEVAPVLKWGLNSVIVSVLAATTVTVSSALVAFGFAYFRFPFRNALFAILLATMMLPGVVTLIPSFIIWNELGFYNTLVPLWAGNLFASAFYVFMLRQFFLGLPRELFEAARVDGASYLRMWWSVAMPLTVAALIVVFIFELKAAWTDVMRPLIFLRNVDLFTLPRGLLAIISSPSITGEQHWALLMAASVIVTLPMVIVFFLGQRYFIEGIATTGSKG